METNVSTLLILIGEQTIELYLLKSRVAGLEQKIRELTPVPVPPPEIPKVEPKVEPIYPNRTQKGDK